MNVVLFVLNHLPYFILLYFCYTYFESEAIKMYKLKKDNYNELSGICRSVMQNIKDLEEGSKMDLFDPRISDEEYHLYSSVLKSYNSLGNQLLSNWETLKFYDIDAFFTKLSTYVEYLDIFIKEPTIENQLRLTSIYDSLDKLNQRI
nr:MAG TPA: hypothetical protein [Caudoviricetes sp.]